MYEAVNNGTSPPRVHETANAIDTGPRDYENTKSSTSQFYENFDTHGDQHDSDIEEYENVES